MFWNSGQYTVYNTVLLVLEEVKNLNVVGFLTKAEL